MLFHIQLLKLMELVKLLATDSILKNDPDKEFDELRFAVDNNGTNILIIINKGEITGAVDIDNMYEFEIGRAHV